MLCPPRLKLTKTGTDYCFVSTEQTKPGGCWAMEVEGGGGGGL